MLVRLRAGIVGLLGLVAAVGLGLIALVSQQGWPGVFNSPLPEEPAPLVRNDTISLPPSLGLDRPVVASHEPGRRDRGQEQGPASTTHLASNLTGSRQAGEPALSAPPGDAETPTSPAPDPPATSTPASVPPPVQTSTAVPVVAGSNDVSSGSSKKSKGKSSGRSSKTKAPGPPPRSGKDDEASDEPKPSYEDPKPAEDDKSYTDDKSYEDDAKRQGKPDWDGG